MFPIFEVNMSVMHNTFRSTSSTKRLKFNFAATIALIALLFSNCGPSENIPDVSKINVALKTYRFDKDLYSIDTNHIAEGLKQLQVKYPDFLNYYLDTVREYHINGNFSDTVRGIREDLRVDLTFKDFLHLQDTITLLYPDSKETDEKLLDAFKYVQYYLPGSVVPRIFYLNMGLSKWPTFPVDNNTLCIGLDMFLGDNFPHYAALGVPPYMLSHTRKSYIPVSLMHTYYQLMHPFAPDDKTLLDLMLQRGKEQYFLHKVLPHTPDSVLFGFTQVQLKWCEENEAVIYNYFIHGNLLFNKDPQNVMPYVVDGPFARGLEDPSHEVKFSPGNIGTWLGYRIVQSYFSQYPATTLKELLTNRHDPSRFLDSAKYRPK